LLSDENRKRFLLNRRKRLSVLNAKLSELAEIFNQKEKALHEMQCFFGYDSSGINKG
jgi:hypothetical protein